MQGNPMARARDCAHAQTQHTRKRSGDKFHHQVISFHLDFGQIFRLPWHSPTNPSYQFEVVAILIEKKFKERGGIECNRRI